MNAISQIFPLHRGAIPAFVVFQSSTIHSDSIRHKSKEEKTSNPISWLWDTPLDVSGVLARRRRAALSLKQLIHSGITKAQRLIEMFSHFSGARSSIVNHSPVVYFEISFGAALFFTAGPTPAPCAALLEPPPSYSTRPLEVEQN